MNTQAPSATAPTVFKFQESTQLRVVTIDGEPWFVAVDVCAALELGNVTKALLRLDEDEKQVVDFSALNSIQGAKNNNLGNSETNVINESGLYSLILGSCKPEAKKFKKWVTSEVLPTIRKTGSYSVIPNNSPADETLTAQDQRNIKRMIGEIARFQRYDTGWVQGVWVAIRKRTGNPSPKPFTVDHLPLIAEELVRVLNAAQKLRDHTRKLERAVLKSVIRGGSSIDAIIAQEEAEQDATLAEMVHGANSVLDDWQIHELNAIAARTALPYGDYRGLDELPLPNPALYPTEIIHLIKVVAHAAPRLRKVVPQMFVGQKEVVSEEATRLQKAVDAVLALGILE
jgi:prophage antirepressor-like protein